MTWATSVPILYFSLPRPLYSRLRPDVRKRQTSDVRRASSLNAPTLGRGHKNAKLSLNAAAVKAVVTTTIRLRFDTDRLSFDVESQSNYPSPKLNAWTRSTKRFDRTCAESAKGEITRRLQRDGLVAARLGLIGSFRRRQRQRLARGIMSTRPRPSSIFQLLDSEKNAVG